MRQIARERLRDLDREMKRERKEHKKEKKKKKKKAKREIQLSGACPTFASRFRGDEGVYMLEHWRSSRS